MTENKRVAILGSTGSIGTQTLDVIRQHPDWFTVEVLTAQHNWELLVAQALEFKPNAVVIGNEDHYSKVKEALSGEPIKVFAGQNAIAQVVEMDPGGSMVAMGVTMVEVVAADVSMSAPPLL